MIFGNRLLPEASAGMSVPIAVDAAASGIQRKDPGFRVRSMVFENPSSDWIFMTDLNRWIPPRIVGKVIRWPPDGPVVEQVSFRVDQAPAGYVVDLSQLAPITIILQDFDQTETAGVAIPPPIATPQSQVVNALPALGNIATLTIAAVPGVAWQVYFITATLLQVTAAAGVNQGLWLRDGNSGVGPILWGAVMGVAAANGSVDRITFTGANIRGTRGNAMTLEFGAAQANTSETCSLGVYPA